MFRKRAENVDVAIIGAGVTGLMLTKKLTDLGVRVALVEKKSTVASGPSTRNEGWLHRGTYHASSIKDRTTAIQVARRCIYGHEQIRRFAPEAVEDPDIPSYAVINDPSRVSETVSRWNEAGVIHKPVELIDFKKSVPESNVSPEASVFEVADVGINTRILYEKLLSQSLQGGASLFLGADSSIKGDNTIVVKQKRGKFLRKKTKIKPKLVIHTSGFGMKEFFKENFGIDLPMRFWKSHLTVIPRLSRSSVFAVDPGEAGMMNHGSYSIVGANEDAVQVETPDYELIENKVANVKSAIRRLYNIPADQEGYSVACIKVDMPLQTEEARSLNINVSEPVKNNLCILPGKMTESAFVTDAVTKIVYGRVRNASHVAQRPMDTLN